MAASHWQLVLKRAFYCPWRWYTVAETCWR